MKKKTRSKKNARKTKRISGGGLTKSASARKSASASARKSASRSASAIIRNDRSIIRERIRASAMALELAKKKGLDHIKEGVKNNYTNDGRVRRFLSSVPEKQIKEYRNAALAEKIIMKKDLEKRIKNKLDTLKKNEVNLTAEITQSEISRFKSKLENILTSETGDMIEKLKDLNIEIKELLGTINIMHFIK